MSVANRPRLHGYDALVLLMTCNGPRHIMLIRRNTRT